MYALRLEGDGDLKPEYGGYPEWIQYYKETFGTSDSAGLVLCVAHDVATLHDGCPVVSLESVECMLRQEDFEIKELKHHLEELEARRLISYDPVGWVDWRTILEDGRPASVRGPAKFTGNRDYDSYFHVFSDTLHIEKDSWRGKQVVYYLADRPEPPSKGERYHFSPAIECIVVD